MPKPSNQDLLAERKAIAALMADIPGDSNEQKAQWLLDEYKRARAAPVIKPVPPPFVDLSANQIIPQPDPMIITIPPREEPGDLLPMSSLPASIQEGTKPKEAGPIDRAHYPQPGEASARTNMQRTDNGPEQATSLGDLTPAYARWFCSTNGPEATRRKYDNRTQFLPADVQAAIR